MKNAVTGIVLAGGNSVRMGSDKGLAKLCGKPLVSYAIQTLEAAGCSVLISSNNPTYEQFGYPVISDKIEGIGPLGGIYSTLMVSETDMNVVLSCDVPLIPAELIQYLILKSARFQSVVPVFNGYPEPLCGCYRKDVTGVIKERVDGRSYKMQDLLKILKTGYIEIDRAFSFYKEKMFANINDPVQLKEIEVELDER